MVLHINSPLQEAKLATLHVTTLAQDSLYTPTEINTTEASTTAHDRAAESTSTQTEIDTKELSLPIKSTESADLPQKKKASTTVSTSLFRSMVTWSKTW